VNVCSGTFDAHCCGSQVSNDGDVLYALPRGFRGIITARSWKLRAEPFFKKVFPQYCKAWEVVVNPRSCMGHSRLAGQAGQHHCLTGRVCAVCVLTARQLQTASFSQFQTRGPCALLRCWQPPTIWRASALALPW